MARRRQPSLNRLTFEEARRATRWQVTGIAVVIFFAVVSLVLTILLFNRQQSATGARVNTAICPAHIRDLAGGVLSTCVVFKPGSHQLGTQEAVRVEFSNEGGSGITVNSMSLVCAIPARCGMQDIVTLGGSSANNIGDLPKYLAPGESSFFVIPMGCDHAALGGNFKKATAVRAILQLSTGEELSTTAVHLAVPNHDEIVQCNARAKSKAPGPASPVPSHT